MNHPVVSALLPVFLLAAVGFFAGRRRWLVGEGLKQLSTLVFVVLTPPLLFRTMASVHLDKLDFRPLGAYFIGSGLIFAVTLAVLGFNRRGAVLGLANTYTNTVMIGIPLVGLAYGEPGLVLLFTLISVHALIMLTSATVLLELAMLREDAAAGRRSERHFAHTVLLAVRNTIIHPVPLPIIAGLLFSWSGLAMPAVIDMPLKLLSGAFGPLALLLVGATLAATPIGANWRSALSLSLVKNLVHPAVVAVAGWAIGLSGAPLAVMVLAAALPIGANVFLFSQRYGVAEELVTASVAMSTMLGLVTLTVVMAVLTLIG
ncbi:AEC family transporter [Caenimonas aquaedulcis]|uniref:AEC family transporter n=1 Tax=Caenimonas aquaedulcis TaxID=2793270 RepID=A0A931H7K3_9BURK|nr:AEC family transporter [Caenimonas aquaedulcis]MBG9390149.1 AEC family transporter [Caenimonas aquaedulcis]